MTMKTTTTKSTDSGPVVPRLLDFEKLLSQKSHFLFGTRQTGKTLRRTPEPTLQQEIVAKGAVRNIPESCKCCHISIFDYI
jgi:predicted AAA+ superfamily ATPase